MKTIHSLYAVVAALSLTACADVPDLPPRRLVIEGTFDSGGYPDVIVTLSIPADGSEVDVSEALMRWATVTISDNTGREVILTGGPSKKHFPPYHYYSYDIKGEPGRTYTLTARYRDLLATSTAYMPYPTPITGTRTHPVEGNDTLRSLEVLFTAPDDCPAYYHVSTQLLGSDLRPLPATLGIVEANTPGEAMSFTAMRAKTSTDTLDYTPYFPIDSEVRVKLERVDKPAYDFWKMFSNSALFGSSEFFDSSFSLPSNIEGGYGIWSPAGTSTVIVKMD